MGREWDGEELERKRMTSENAPATRWDRTKTRFADIFDYFTDPVMTELLPPRPLPHPQAPHKPYTLLISIDDLLVTSTWDRQHGWRTAKRPGVDYFLAYISQFYELVVFTTQYSYTAMPILDQLDRYNFYIEHRLFREHTRSQNGQVVKDLSYLNRDLSKVVLLDTNPDHVLTHPENAVIMPKWTGDKKDNGLVAMIPFLESIAIYKPADVRPILTAYQGKNIPVEYAKREAEGKQKHIENWKQNKGSTSNSFGGFFGVSSRSTQNAPLTYLEQKRKEAQQQYLDEQAQIAKNKDYLESLLKHEQAVMAAQAPSNFWEAFEAVRGNPKQLGEIPPPPPPPPGMGLMAPPVYQVGAVPPSGSSGKEETKVS
ncbi:HAD-like domain-containing protein [Rhodocollybia butyracea]|uniref:Mitochondrial import inner membrane translocase subunit TIM50 n=1 Tax=Rhodocollybia butyracea TaxID=206335 RepID=A0A9P5PNF6_9AGAR|nr:HAD-like domain-containing protein [Rhodocollybia butyracea]